MGLHCITVNRADFMDPIAAAVCWFFVMFQHNEYIVQYIIYIKK